MALVVSALLTNAGREALAKSFGGATGGFNWSAGKYFKIGVSARMEVSGQDQPLPPNAAYTDIQSVGAEGFYYRKTFIASDILFVAPATIQFRCFLDLEDGNGTEADTAVDADGPKATSTLAGSAPVYYELGIFDDQDVMIAYGTFPGETKLNTKTLNHLVNINF